MLKVTGTYFLYPFKIEKKQPFTVMMAISSLFVLPTHIIADEQRIRRAISEQYQIAFETIHPFIVINHVDYPTPH